MSLSPEASAEIAQLAAHEQACTGYLFVHGPDGPLFVSSTPIGIIGTNDDKTHRSPVLGEYVALSEKAGIKDPRGGICGVYGGEHVAIYCCTPASSKSGFPPASSVPDFNTAAERGIALV